MKKVLFLICTVFLVSVNADAQDRGAGGERPPPSVVVITPKIKDVSEKQEFLGTVEAVESVNIIPRVEGYLEKEHFAEGQEVKKGELLYSIEDSRYQALVNQAKANLAKAKAARNESKLELDRVKSLFEKDAAPKARLEQAQAKYLTADAEVSASQAFLETAELNLSYTEIKSPVDGQTGVSRVSVGDLLAPNSAVLTTVNTIDPMRVVFSMSETFLLNTLKNNQSKNREEINSFLTPFIVLSSGEEYGHSGKIDFINNQIDPTTGTIEVRALFDNPDRFLIPGQFVKVKIRVGEERKALVIPAESLQRDQKGNFVVKVDKEGNTTRADIEVGVKKQGYAEIKSGLDKSDKIVFQGIQKMQLGQKVNPVVKSETEEDTEEK